MDPAPGKEAVLYAAACRRATNCSAVSYSDSKLHLASTLAAHAYYRPLARFIEAERDRLSPIARGLTVNEQARLHPQFSIQDLERVRLVAGHAVKDPPYASFLRRFGSSIPTTALAEAITLDSLIASPQPLEFTTLVHEMVHCVQYRVLGIHRFSFDYVQGFCAFGYEGIPLERNAVDLSRRFLVGETFVVEEELRRNFGHL